ncbi:MAG: DUF5596 domain-containing protein [Oscillospiraceae bacterium]|nr:DUF5596 domain-containing protein [Oscillospiraceae bacterium]
MRNRSAWLRGLMNNLNYPEKAVTVLLEAYETMRAAPQLEQALAVYENNWMFDYRALLSQITHAGDACGIPEETAHMVFVLCMAEHMKRLYQQRDIPEEMYWDAMCDTRCKLLECRQIRGVWGTFVAHWYDRFFLLTRFAIGRLQFEPALSPGDFQWEGDSVKQGEPVIKVHIPSSGPLRQDACVDAFRRAGKWFAPLFPNGGVLFFCASWLVSPDHVRMLPPESNIRKFMDFFHIFPGNRTVEKDLWRIFGSMDTDPERLPRDTGLRRGYAEALERGEIPVMGYGIFRNE